MLGVSPPDALAAAGGALQPSWSSSFLHPSILDDHSTPPALSRHPPKLPVTACEFGLEASRDENDEIFPAAHNDHESTYMQDLCVILKQEECGDLKRVVE